jgi:hypothetical protein
MNIFENKNRTLLEKMINILLKISGAYVVIIFKMSRNIRKILNQSVMPKIIKILC